MTGSTHGEVGCGRVSDGSIRRLNSYRSKIAHWCRFVYCQLPLLLRIHHLFAFSSFHFLQENLAFNTLFEIFISCPKIQLWFPEKIVNFFGVKNSWKCCGFGLFSCWQLWFHEKNSASLKREKEERKRKRGDGNRFWVIVLPPLFSQS